MWLGVLEWGRIEGSFRDWSSLLVVGEIYSIEWEFFFLNLVFVVEVGLLG